MIALYVAFDNGQPHRFWDNPDYDYNKLRSSEKEITSYEDAQIVAVFSIKSNTTLAALLSMLRTVFVCIVFTIGSLFFSKDAKKLVIEPIANMIHKVNKIARDPLEAA